MTTSTTRVVLHLGLPRFRQEAETIGRTYQFDDGKTRALVRLEERGSVLTVTPRPDERTKVKEAHLVFCRAGEKTRSPATRPVRNLRRAAELFVFEDLPDIPSADAVEDGELWMLELTTQSLAAHE